MAQTREQIAQVIESLNIGDTIVVTWDKSGNVSTETGKVWQPPAPNTYLGLGPDLLNPNDPELVGITVSSRAPTQVSQPPLGSVAVFRNETANSLLAFKRVRRGWQTTGDRTALPWGLLSIAYKAPIAVFSPGTPPAKPTISTLTAGNRKIDVVATLGSAGSSAISDVQYQLIYEFEDGFQESTGWVSSGQTTGSFPIVNLEPGIDFTVRVRALNASGAGPQSDPLTVTPFTTPDAPISVSATAGNAQAVLTWTAPENFGFSPITGYKIEKILAANNDGWVTVTENTASTATTYTVTGLTNGQLIGFRVTAINAAGLGTPSASTVGVTPSA